MKIKKAQNVRSFYVLGLISLARLAGFETDKMIELLEKRQRELDLFINRLIAIITFNSKKRSDEVNGTNIKIQISLDEKNKLSNFIKEDESIISILEENIENISSESIYLEGEINAIEEKLKIERAA